jgi:hypothetical protein
VWYSNLSWFDLHFAMAWMCAKPSFVALSIVKIC